MPVRGSNAITPSTHASTPGAAASLGREDDLWGSVEERAADLPLVADAGDDAKFKVGERPQTPSRQEHDVAGLEVAANSAPEQSR